MAKQVKTVLLSFQNSQTYGVNSNFEEGQQEYERLLSEGWTIVAQIDCGNWVFNDDIHYKHVRVTFVRDEPETPAVPETEMGALWLMLRNVAGYRRFQQMIADGEFGYRAIKVVPQMITDVFANLLGAEFGAEIEFMFIPNDENGEIWIMGPSKEELEEYINQLFPGMLIGIECRSAGESEESFSYVEVEIRGRRFEEIVKSLEESSLPVGVTETGHYSDSSSDYIRVFGPTLEEVEDWMRRNFPIEFVSAKAGQLEEEA